jgi:hypothetical protein
VAVHLRRLGGEAEALHRLIPGRFDQAVHRGRRRLAGIRRAEVDRRQVRAQPGEAAEGGQQHNEDGCGRRGHNGPPHLVWPEPSRPRAQRQRQEEAQRRDLEQIAEQVGFADLLRPPRLGADGQAHGPRGDVQAQDAQGGHALPPAAFT